MMIKPTLCFLVFCSSLNGFSQVTDNDIVKSLLGKSYFNVNPILDKLGVWYHYNFQPNTSASGDDLKPKIYSISNSAGSVKVYILNLDKERLIEEIVINFRHDSKEQVEDIAKMKSPTDYHVGTYSTDIIYKLEK